MRRDPKPGFTLIELLVGIAVIAILKWLATLYPLSENNWELSPSPDSNNRTLHGPPGCDGTKAPSAPGAKEFQTKECLAYQ